MFKKINDDAKLPTRATRFSAGVDVYANEDVTINAGETAIVGVGIAIDLEAFMYANFTSTRNTTFDEIPDIVFNERELNDFLKSHYISLKPQSSLRAKGLISHSAVINLDYKDEIKMIVHNPIGLIDYDLAENTLYQYGTKLSGYNYEQSIKIKKGDKTGQLLLMEHKSYLFLI